MRQATRQPLFPGAEFREADERVELFELHHAILDALIHDSSRKGELKKYMKTSFDE